MNCADIWKRRTISLFGLMAVCAFSLVPANETRAQNKQQIIRQKNTLEKEFQRAAKEFGVPSDILKAVAYSETHFDDHGGKPSFDNGYGIMHLVDNEQNQSLVWAANLLGTSKEELQTNRAANIRGAAALLKFYADESSLTDRQNADAWYEAVAKYSNSRDLVVARFYADEVYRLLGSGFEGAGGEETIIVGAREVEPKRGAYEYVTTLDSAVSPDYPSALYVPAYSGNYTASNRTTSYPINYVIIHTVQGSYSSAINWFTNPSANVSAHYVVRSSDGQITQSVREKDIAWHAGNWTYNTQSIGIEHEGYVNNASWYTDAMYRASAALTRNLCIKYGIPMTRSRIIGHSEVPSATHTDPGPNWNWTYYMQLVTQTTAYSTIVDNATSGRFTSSGNWGVSTYSSQRYGANYEYAAPAPVSDAAWFKANIPSSGNYEVFVWYPANSGYNDSTPFAVTTSSGTKFVNVNQQINGGTWVSLGTFGLTAGDYNVVGVSRWTNGTGYVVADAVKIVRK